MKRLLLLALATSAVTLSLPKPANADPDIGGILKGAGQIIDSIENSNSGEYYDWEWEDNHSQRRRRRRGGTWGNRRRDRGHEMIRYGRNEKVKFNICNPLDYSVFNIHSDGTGPHEIKPDDCKAYWIRGRFNPTVKLSPYTSRMDLLQSYYVDQGRTYQITDSSRGWGLQRIDGPWVYPD